MTMTKRNFEDAAFRVQQVEANLGKHEAEVVCAAFVGFFADDNPRFDAARFEKACKLGANVKAREAGEERKLTNSDISQWIDNDEGLYDWWRSSRKSKTAFIKENREELEGAINAVLSGNKPAHHLKYGYESKPKKRRAKRSRKK